jgi:hypothetical protein
VRYGLNYYEEVSSVELCFATRNSFYYDKVNFRVIINITENGIPYQVPFGKRIEIGLITGYSTHVDFARDDEAYYDDIYYDPCVEEIGDITLKRDNLYTGVNSYASLTVKLRNHHGKFDGSNLSGSIAKLYTLEDGAELTADALCQYGIIQKYSIEDDFVSLTITDRRMALDKQYINLGTINPIDFPYLYDTEDGDEDTGEYDIFPIIIGKFVDYKPTLLNKSEHNSAVATYALCKAYNGTKKSYQLKQIDYLWINKSDSNGVQYDLIIPPSGGIVTNPGTLSPDSKYAEVASGVSYAVERDTGKVHITRSAVCTGETDGGTTTYSWMDIHVSGIGWYDAENNGYLCGVDLTRIAYEIFADIEYEAWNFDVSAYAREMKKSLKQGRNYSKIIDGSETSTSISDFVKNVCDSSNTIVNCLGAGRFTPLVLDRTYTPIVATLKRDQLFAHKDGKTVDMSQIVSTAKIEYGPAGNSENKKTITFDQEDYVVSTYHLTNPQEYTGLCLLDKASATLKWESIKSEATAPLITTDFTVWSNPTLLHLQAVDCFVAPRERGSEKTAIYQITSIKKSISKNKIEITGIWISDVTAEDGYTQGILYDTAILGSSFYGTTSRIDED